MISRLRNPFYTVSFILVAAGAILPFAQSIGFPFSFADDGKYVYSNVALRTLPLGDFIRWSFSSLYYGNWSPLTWLSLRLDYSLWGLWPGGYRITSLILHTATCLLFLRFLLMFVEKRAALLLALLFAVHPVHTEPVVWISSRKDLLSGFFIMLSLVLYSGYAAKRASVLFIFPVAAFLCALASKPTAFVLPALFFLIDWWPLRRRTVPLLQLFEEKSVFIVFSAASLFLAIEAQSNLGAIDPADTPPLSVRAGSAAVYIWIYVKNTFWPFHIGFPYSPRHFESWTMALSIISAMIVTALCWKARRKRPELLFGIVFFLVTILPCTGIVQVGPHPIADRWMYIPLAGLLFPFTAFLPEKSRTAGVLSTVPVIVLSAASFIQTGYWSKDASLLSHSVSSIRGNCYGHTYLGITLAREGDLSSAESHLEKALDTCPQDRAAFERLAAVLSASGNAAALAHALPSRDEIPSYAMRRYAEELFILASTPPAAAVYESRHGRNPLSECIEKLNLVLQQDPAEPFAHNSMALASAFGGDFKAATWHARTAVALRPMNAEFRSNLGVLLFRLGEKSEAEQELKTAAESGPGMGEPFLNLSVLLYSAGRLEEALEWTEKAGIASPENPSVISLREKILLKQGRGD